MAVQLLFRGVFNIANNIFVQFSTCFFSIRSVSIHLVHPYFSLKGGSLKDMGTSSRNFVAASYLLKVTSIFAERRCRLLSDNIYIYIYLYLYLKLRYFYPALNFGVPRSQVRIGIVKLLVAGGDILLFNIVTFGL